ncbi:YdcF family protein [Bacilliculturomica massiliensis]|uniref:YdcF family protein n=1 Tax=Bacilliculturomica massiliensis TaxID=1917867 RepID=UPI0010305FFD|nr:YdcF family protein [Bacilliculturomica massiliensis]
MKRDGDSDRREKRPGREQGKTGSAEKAEDAAAGGRRRSRRQLALYGCGGVSLLYFAGLGIYLGAVYLFQWFWLALGILLMGAGRLLPVWNRFPGWFRVLWKAGVALSLAVFCVLMGLIISGMVDEPSPGADYVIVLGAKVNGTRPSLSLRYRIEAAADYLKQNPRTRVVASGGQGANEGISEARAIAEMLVRMGIGEERIIWEDRSTSTTENLTYSWEKIREEGADPGSARVVVVSSDFHVFRARAIARRCGYGSVEGLSARSVPGLQPNYCVRECFAILNDGLRGNLSW